MAPMSKRPARPTDPLAETEWLLVDGTNLLFAMSRAPGAAPRVGAHRPAARGRAAVGRHRCRLRRARRARAARRAHRVGAAGPLQRGRARPMPCSCRWSRRPAPPTGRPGPRRSWSSPTTASCRRSSTPGARGRPVRTGCSAGSTASGAAARPLARSRSRRSRPTKPRPVPRDAVRGRRPRRRPLGTGARRDRQEGEPEAGATVGRPRLTASTARMRSEPDRYAQRHLDDDPRHHGPVRHARLGLAHQHPARAHLRRRRRAVHHRSSCSARSSTSPASRG